MNVLEQIKNYYNNVSSSTDIAVNDKNIVVTVTYEGSEIDEFDILFIEGYKLTVSTWACAETSFCERYGVVTESNLYLTYTSKSGDAIDQL